MRREEIRMKLITAILIAFLFAVALSAAAQLLVDPDPWPTAASSMR